MSDLTYQGIPVVFDPPEGNDGVCLAKLNEAWADYYNEMKDVTEYKINMEAVTFTDATAGFWKNSDK